MIATLGAALLVPTRAAVPVDAASRAPRVAGQYGLASFYGRAFQGRRTASGVPFDARKLVAAHPRYAFGTRLRVTNLENGRSVVVRVIDRGPAPKHRRAGVIIDVSRAAAERLGFIRAGRTRVRVAPVEPARARVAAD